MLVEAIDKLRKEQPLADLEQWIAYYKRMSEGVIGCFHIFGFPTSGEILSRLEKERERILAELAYRRCKNCKHWTPCGPEDFDFEHRIPAGFGSCGNKSILCSFEYDKQSVSKANPDALTSDPASLGINDNAEVVSFGPDFGCVHWEAKEAVKPS